MRLSFVDNEDIGVTGKTKEEKNQRGIKISKPGETQVKVAFPTAIDTCCTPLYAKHVPVCADKMR